MRRRGVWGRWTRGRRASGSDRGALARRRGAAPLIVATLLLGASPAAAELDRAAALTEMRALYGSIETLLPLAVDDARFRSAAERERIRGALAQLAARSEHLGRHVAGDDRRIRYLARALSRETREAMARFDEGRLDGAQFLVKRLTNFCVACHTRVPSPADSLLSRGFVSDEALVELPADQRAALQVATRRFDDALATWEALFASSRVRAAELLAPIGDYLRVSIRVKNDLARPLATLRRFAARDDLWSNLRGDVDHWIAALERHAADPRSEPSLAAARALLDEARQVLRYPTDRRGLVQHLLASSELHRFLEARPDDGGRDIAEAYYLMGLIESRTNFDYLVSESDFYLETAIRLAPGDPIGQAAFDLLEEETVLGWTGSGGSHMPQDVRRRLDALRELVEGEPEQEPGDD